jgi:hypothetical protein
LFPELAEITTEVTLEEAVQVSVTGRPANMVAGLAVNVTVSGGGAGFTVTVACAVAVPPAPVTV